MVQRHRTSLEARQAVPSPVNAGAPITPDDAHEAGADRARTVSAAVEATPHATSVAVWDVPSPVAVGRPFTLKVGVTCSARCQLAQRLVELRDENGAMVGQGRLGGQPWPGSQALFWAEVGLVAPTTTGLIRWAAGVSGCRIDETHGDASTPFTFVTVGAPEHRVTLKVAGSDTKAPVGGADIRVGVYRAVTDADGEATLELPGGTYDVSIWSDGYEGPPLRLEVRADVTVVVDAVKTLSAAEKDEQLEQWEASRWG